MLIFNCIFFHTFILVFSSRSELRVLGIRYDRLIFFSRLTPYRPVHKLLVLIPLLDSVLFPSAGCPVSLVTKIVTGQAMYV